jgi:hypothetical protein
VTLRRTALTGGVLVLIAYLGGAIISARLSPFARRPLLDGLAPTAPYRWVNPPPDLAADTNKPPTPGRFALNLTSSGSQGGAFTTPDAQVTVIVPNDAIAPSAGQDTITLTVQPLDPATLDRPSRSLVVLGNAIRIAATYGCTHLSVRPRRRRRPCAPGVEERTGLVEGPRDRSHRHVASDWADSLVRIRDGRRAPFE